jgi:hypothetical protein
MNRRILEMKHLQWIHPETSSFFGFCAYITQYVQKETQPIDEIFAFVSFTHTHTHTHTRTHTHTHTHIYIHFGKFVFRKMICHIHLCEKCNSHHSQQFLQWDAPLFEHSVLFVI